MLVITQSQIDHLTMKLFFSRLRGFIKVRCQNPKLVEWIRSQGTEEPFWTALWPDLRHSSEHDCALALVHAAAMECEGLRGGAATHKGHHRDDREIQMKLFLRDRGYFAFSDFDGPPSPQPSTPEDASHGE